MDLKSFLDDVALGITSSEASQMAILRRVMLETADSERGLEKTVDASRKELERVGTSVHDIQVATTGDKIGDIHQLLVKSAEASSRSSTPSTPASDINAISLETTVTMMADAMLLAAKLAIKSETAG